MNGLLFFTAIIAILFILEWGYLQLAKKYAIIDKPNLRSSHDRPIVRGGGVIFPLAWLLYMCINGFIFPWMTLGLIALAVVSFIDDIKTLSAAVRFPVHLGSFLLCFYELDLFVIYPIWIVVVILVLCIGSINAFNFMDGINGITGMYALVFLLPFLVAGNWTAEAMAGSPYSYLFIGVVVFGFFNFRKVAKCFAGDIGSISLAYILIFILLTQATSNTPGLKAAHPAVYLLLFAVYGIDSVLTILQRLYLKQNIFQPHRMHLYQLLANEMKVPHLQVAFLYAVAQNSINMLVWRYTLTERHVLMLLGLMTILYILIKRYVYLKMPIKTSLS